MKRHRLCAPLLLELIGAFVWRRSPEVENAAALSHRRVDDVPVEKMIRTERVVVPDRGRPWHLNVRARTKCQPRRNRYPVQADDVDVRPFWKGTQHLVEKTARIYGRAEVAHIPRKHRVELAHQLTATPHDRQPRLLRFPDLI